MSVLLTEGFESGDKQESDSMLHALLNIIIGVEQCSRLGWYNSGQ